MCTNKLPALMGDLDTAVMEAIERTLLHPTVVERAVAHAESLLQHDRTGDQRAAAEVELADIERAISRLTQAIATGGELQPLIDAMQAHERKRTEVAARLAALQAPAPKPAAPDVRKALHAYLADWQGLLRGHVQQAQQILRRLVNGKLTVMPQADGHYAFSGVGTVRPLLAGVICPS